MILPDLLKEGRNDIILWLGHGWYSKGLPGVAYDRPLVKARQNNFITATGKQLFAQIQPGQEGTAVIPASVHGGQGLWRRED